MKRSRTSVCQHQDSYAVQPKTATEALDEILKICRSAMSGADEKLRAIRAVLETLRMASAHHSGALPELRLESLYCPECGEFARGTVETLSGVAEFEVAADGTIAYSGYTDVWWEEQRTVTDDGGNVRLVCANGHDWAARTAGEGPRS